MSRLQDNGFTVNPLKYEWTVKETDWLGYWITPVGLKPWKKKIQGILNMDHPQNNKQVKSFLGVVNFYRDLWPRQSHVLTPLTTLTGKGTFEWKEEHERSFQEIKALLVSEGLQKYPDHNKPFEIYTDASEYQLRACIMQEGQPMAYYSKRLNPTQQRYSTMEKELLSIVYTLSEFKPMVLGTKLTIYTDHKNLAFNTLKNARILRWQLFFKEYDATYIYIKGKENVLANAFSRLPTKETRLSKVEENIGHSLFSSIYKDPELFNCLQHLPTEHHQCYANFPEEQQNPTSFPYLQQHQLEDLALLTIREQNPGNFPITRFGNVLLICYIDNNTHTNNFRICIPTAILKDLIQRFHTVLGHAGKTRVYNILQRTYHHPRLNKTIDAMTCDVCLRNKQNGQGYGMLPQRLAPIAPWGKVHVDLIGPWKVRINNNIELEFLALTCIDPLLNLTELARVNNKTSAHVSLMFNNIWLSCYPKPMFCVHDNGGEFIGWEFQTLLENTEIEDKPKTSKNSTANAICECMHQIAGNVLRTLLHGQVLDNNSELNQILDNVLATAMHTLRAAVSPSLKTQDHQMRVQLKAEKVRMASHAMKIALSEQHEAH